MSDNIVNELQQIRAAIRNLQTVVDVSYDIIHTVPCCSCKRSIQGIDRIDSVFEELITSMGWTHDPAFGWSCPNC